MVFYVAFVLLFLSGDFCYKQDKGKESK